MLQKMVRYHDQGAVPADVTWWFPGIEASAGADRPTGSRRDSGVAEPPAGRLNHAECQTILARMNCIMRLMLL